MNKIDSASLHHLVRRQGILLEHETHDLLLNYFRQDADHECIRHAIDLDYRLENDKFHRDKAAVSQRRISNMLEVFLSDVTALIYEAIKLN